ncbi:30S ribosomal protein S21 [Candidatus Thorarchaeota archaeon]|nr:MAG: 30S ribosomal protein S21 [Candidatus Thorarchaeota archaeon]
MPKVFLNMERQGVKDIENAIRKLKKKVENGGVLKALHDKQQYERPGVKRNKKRAAAIMRTRRENAKFELPKKMY